MAPPQSREEKAHQAWAPPAGAATLSGLQDPFPFSSGKGLQKVSLQGVVETENSLVDTSVAFHSKADDLQ